MELRRALGAEQRLEVGDHERAVAAERLEPAVKRGPKPLTRERVLWPAQEADKRLKPAPDPPARAVKEFSLSAGWRR